MAWPLCWGRDCPSRLPRATFCAQPLRAARVRLARLGLLAQAAEVRGAAVLTAVTVRVPGPRGGCAFPAAGEVAAPRAPGSALPNLRVPARALPAHPAPALAPQYREVSTPGYQVSPRAREGVGRSEHKFSGGPGRRGGGGGAERRRPADGRNSKLRWKSSGCIKEEKPDVCGTTKVQGGELQR